MTENHQHVAPRPGGQDADARQEPPVDAAVKDPAGRDAAAAKGPDGRVDAAAKGPDGMRADQPAAGAGPAARPADDGHTALLDAVEPSTGHAEPSAGDAAEPSAGERAGTPPSAGTAPSPGTAPPAGTAPSSDGAPAGAAAPTPPATPDNPRAAAVAAAKRREPGHAAVRQDLDPEARRRNQAREAALSAKPVLPRILQTVLAVAFPFLLLIGAVKAVASPWFLWLEYHRAGFPADGFGFTLADRLTYGSYGVDYLNNAAGPDYLGELVDRSGNPLFLDTEVAHMADVKAVVAVTFTVGLVLLAAVVAIALYLRRRYAGGVRRGLFAGSVATIGLLLVVAVLGVLNWQALFATFHQVFFADGTWTFRTSDTLIRLYPAQFWVDSGIAVAALAFLVALGTMIATWPTARRRERSRLRQQARDFGLGDFGTA